MSTVGHLRRTGSAVTFWLTQNEKGMIDLIGKKIRYDEVQSIYQKNVLHVEIRGKQPMLRGGKADKINQGAGSL